LNRYVAGFLLVVAAVVAVQMVPDLIRYQRIRSM